jgi:hypothetical protein
MTGRRQGIVLLGALLGCGACTTPPSLQENRSAFTSGSHEPAPDDRADVGASGAEVASSWREPVPEPEPPRAEELLSPELAETPAAAKLVILIAEVRAKLVETRYQHDTEVRHKTGYYAWDCSGMMAWLLRRSAPRAFRALEKSRPRAIEFYRAITRAPKSRAKRGWRQLAHVSDARAGDLFAFPRSPLSRSRITGHVGVFVERPWQVPGLQRAWAARILDATRIPHQDDTRSDDGVGGFGFGTMMFINDESGKTIGYGWHGTNSGGYLPTHVAYGRVTR